MSSIDNLNWNNITLSSLGITGGDSFSIEDIHSAIEELTPYINRKSRLRKKLLLTIKQ